MRAVYEFHVYYQIRRLLKEIVAPLPEDGSWNAFNNPYNRAAYVAICDNFGVDANTDWRQRASRNRGLGSIYNYFPLTGYRIWHNWDYRPQIMSLTAPSKGELFHIDYIAQGAEADRVWTTFVTDDSQGFTREGAVRLSDSIRMYVYCILAAQGNIRTNIIGSGNALTAQDKFLTLVNHGIDHPVDAKGYVAQYQEVLKNARSARNYVVGYNLHLMPSDMQPHMLDEQIDGYNNLIQVATNEMKLGLNEHINNISTVVKRTPQQGPLPPHHGDVLPPCITTN